MQLRCDFRSHMLVVMEVAQATFILQQVKGFHLAWYAGQEGVLSMASSVTRLELTL